MGTAQQQQATPPWSDVPRPKLGKRPVNSHRNLPGLGTGYLPAIM